MNYAIKFARKGTYTLWLEKNGNRYVVGDFDTITHTHTFNEEYERFEDAERRFLTLCAEREMTPQNVEHDPADFNFD